MKNTQKFTPSRYYYLFYTLMGVIVTKFCRRFLNDLGHVSFSIGIY